MSSDENAIARFLAGEQSDESEVAEATRRAAWESLARRIRAAPPRERISLFRGAWRWMLGDGRAPDPVTPEEQDVGHSVREWALQPAELALAGGGPRQLAPETQPLRLALSLPEGAGRLHLEIAPEYVATEQKSVWYLRFMLAPESRVKSLLVGVGTAGRQTAGPRSLEPQELIEFRLNPPAREPYWVYCAWSSPQGRRQHASEIPVVGEEEGG